MPGLGEPRARARPELRLSGRRLGLYGHVVAERDRPRRARCWSASGCSRRFSPSRIVLVRSARPDRGNAGRAAGRDRPALRAALSVRRRQAGARRVQPRHRGRAHRAHHRAARDAARALGRHRARPAGRLFRPARSTPCCRSSPISCWPSRSSCCSTSWCRPASWRRRSPIRWRRSSSLFPIVLFSVLFIAGYRAQPAALAVRLGADLHRRRLAVRDLRLRRRSVRAHPASAPARSTSSSPSRSPPAPASSASCAA